MDHPLPALLALAAALPAQAPNNAIGTSRAFVESHLARFDAMPSPGGTANVDCLNRLDAADFAHYFADANGNRAIAGMQLALHDANDLTTEDYSLVYYGEDPARPGFPDANGPLLRLGPLHMPPPLNPTQASSVTWWIGIGFSPELVLPDNGQTLFYGFGLSPAPGNNYPNDGLSVLVLTDSIQDADHDQPGRAATAIPHGTYSCWMLTVNGLPSAPPSYLSGTPGSRELLYCDLGGIGAGGAPVAQTNQASYWISNQGPWGPTNQGGTTSMFSGMHPDVFGFHAGRRDDPGYLFYDQSLPLAPVLILAALGPAAFGTLPTALLPGFDPGSFGLLCLDPANSVRFLAFTNQDGYAQVMLPLSNSARLLVQNNPGIDLWWQGVGLDLATAQPTLHATGCARQHL